MGGFSSFSLREIISDTNEFSNIFICNFELFCLSVFGLMVDLLVLAKELYYMLLMPPALVYMRIFYAPSLKFKRHLCRIKEPTAKYFPLVY